MDIVAILRRKYAAGRRIVAESGGRSTASALWRLSVLTRRRCGVPLWELCYSALTRRGVGLSLYDRELCAGERIQPAGYRPAQAFVRAGVWRRGGGSSIAALCVRITPAVCRMSAKQDGLQQVAFLFRRGSESPLERSRALARLSRIVGSLGAGAFPYGDSDGDPEEVQEATGKPPGGRMSLE